MKLPASFYQRSNVLLIAKELLGKKLCTKIDGKTTCGLITETEAYAGTEDKASHAYRGKPTKRTAVMFGSGGRTYMFVCYGIHQMLNIVTNESGVPHAILIRAILPTVGIDIMQQRRGTSKSGLALTTGPGTVAQALGLTREHNDLPVDGETIWIEETAICIQESDLLVGPRVGIDYAQQHKDLPWRFRLAPNTLESLIED